MDYYYLRRAKSSVLILCFVAEFEFAVGHIVSGEGIGLSELGGHRACGALPAGRVDG